MSQQESKQGKKDNGARLQKTESPQREMFDIEDDAATQTKVAPSARAGAESAAASELDAVLKREQAEVDKLRQEMAPVANQEVPSFDPDEHLP
jgi:hypothetical protein